MMSMIKPIADLLRALLPISSNWKLHILQQWPTIMGDISNHAMIHHIDDDSITLSVYDSCWMQELYLLTPLLLEKINKNLDSPRIKRLRFKRAPIAKKKQVVAPTTHSSSAKVKKPTAHDLQALEKIDDDLLKGALEAFLIRCYRERA